MNVRRSRVDRRGQGLSDKHYWRFLSERTIAHCFVRRPRADGRGFVSLCGRHVLVGVGTQASARPPAIVRCAACDIHEMQLRGWQESGPVTL